MALVAFSFAVDGISLADAQLREVDDGHLRQDSRFWGYQEQLERERYETAIARERAERAYLVHQTRSYEYNQRSQEIALQRAEQDRKYSGRYNEISSVSQVANSAAYITQQIQSLARGGGW